MLKLIPDPRRQGEGDEGGEERTLAGAVREEHTWTEIRKNEKFHHNSSQSLTLAETDLRSGFVRHKTNTCAHSRLRWY